VQEQLAVQTAVQSYETLFVKMESCCTTENLETMLFRLYIPISVHKESQNVFSKNLNVTMVFIQ